MMSLVLLTSKFHPVHTTALQSVAVTCAVKNPILYQEKSAY